MSQGQLLQAETLGHTAAGSPATSSRLHARIDPVFLALIGTALLVGLGRRALVGWDAPLWLDEVFTGTVAIRPTLDGVIQDSLRDLSGFPYYCAVWLWQNLFGAGNVSLRWPSLLFAIAAPVLILLKGHADIRTRLIWAGLTALWAPGFHYATEARAYAMLFLLGTAQVILFTRLLGGSSMRHALQWAVVSALLTLTHYHTLPMTVAQGLIYLATHRESAMRNWPAALVFVPVAIWMAVHLPLVLRYTTTAGLAWQPLLTASDIPGISSYLFGIPGLAGLLLALVLVTTGIDLWKWRAGQPWPYDRRDGAAVAASAVALLVIVAAGFVRPSFSPRYLIPIIPGLLFGLSLWARHWGERWRWLPALLLSAYIVWGTRDLAVQRANPMLDMRRGYSWQEASEVLKSKGVERLVFVWVNPSAPIVEREYLGRVGGFFLARAGSPVETDAITVGRSDEAARHAIRSEADRSARATGVVTLSPLDRQLDLSLVDRRWTCIRLEGPTRAYAADALVTACHRAALTDPARS